MSDSYDHFRVAFQNYVRFSGHGIQTQLAKEMGKTSKHINDVVKGRSRAGIKTQEQIANFFGLPLEKMLARGRDILERQEIIDEPFEKQKLNQSIDNDNLQDSISKMNDNICKLTKLIMELLVRLNKFENMISQSMVTEKSQFSEFPHQKESRSIAVIGDRIRREHYKYETGVSHQEKQSFFVKNR